MTTRRTFLLLAAVVLSPALWLGWQWLPTPWPSDWSESERQLIQSLSLTQLPPLPADHSNAVADNPDAARLGQYLFFDTRLSANGSVSCATCHQTLAEGLAQTDRNTMGLPGVAYSPWLFWDGRKDSLWSQALEPLENPREHGINRVQMVRLLAEDSRYRTLFRAAFGDDLVEQAALQMNDRQRFPDASPLGSTTEQQAWQRMTDNDRELVNRVFSNAGKALAAWQRLLLPDAAAFDRYADSLSRDDATPEPERLTSDAEAGLRLFIRKAQCINCHNGPLFSNNAFHNTAVLSAAGLPPAAGRSEGLRRALADEFNCQGIYSDANPQDCAELRFARGGDDMIGAQRTASLRNLSATAPYMHAGQIKTLGAVIDHYNRAEVAVLGHNEAKPLRLRSVEKRQLLAFLLTLNGGIATDRAWLQNPWITEDSQPTSTASDSEDL